MGEMVDNSSTQIKDDDEFKRAYFLFCAIKKHLLSLDDALDDLEDFGLDNYSYDYFETELKISTIYLMIRKVIESLMLMSVSAHISAGVEISKAIRKEWNAERIIKKLEAINPKFFPDAIEVVLLEDDPDFLGRFVKVKEPYLNKKGAAEIYNFCGSVLHEPASPLCFEEIKIRLEKAETFLKHTLKLLEAFELDISGSGHTVLGHLQFELSSPPKIFRGTIEI